MDFKRPNEQSGHDIDAQFEQSYTPKDAPAPTAQPAAAPTAPTVAKKSSKGYKFLTSLLIVLLMAATGYAVYGYFNEQTLRTDLSAANEQKDNLTTLNTVLTNKLSETKAKTVTQTVDDKDLITAVVKARYNAEVAYKDSTVQVAVTKVSGDLARANATLKDGTGAKLILKKVNDTWTIIFEGQNSMDEASMKKYGIPADF